MRSVHSIVLVLGLAGSFCAHAFDASPGPETTLLGCVYPEGSNAPPTFTIERRLEGGAEKSVLSERFKDKEGKTVALLESTYLNGGIQSIAFEQSQSRESATAQFRDGRVFFTHTEEGSTTKSDQTVAGKWVPLSAVPEEIIKNWDAMTDGKTMGFAIPVPVMRDHFMFSVARQRTWTENGKRLTEFKMQPTSMVLRLVADAMYYVFDDHSRALVEYRGVTIAKSIDKGKLKDVNARIVYSPAALMNPTGK